TSSIGSDGSRPAPSVTQSRSITRPARKPECSIFNRSSLNGFLVQPGHCLRASASQCPAAESECMADFDPGVADAEIAAVFDPFVKERFALDDPAWTTLVSDNARLQRRNRLRRRLIGWAPSFRRTQDSIQRDYSQQWAAQTFNAQLSIEGPTVPCLWRTTGMLARAIATKRVHLLFLMGVIARLKPTNVLEVGCGNGLNLFVLAGRFPGIRFTGIELTAGGIAAAEAVCALPELPQAVQDFAPEPLIDPKPFDRITIRQGNAAALPLSDRSFDLVFTSL